MCDQFSFCSFPDEVGQPPPPHVSLSSGLGPMACGALRTACTCPPALHDRLCGPRFFLCFARPAFFLCYLVGCRLVLSATQRPSDGRGCGPLLRPVWLGMAPSGPSSGWLDLVGALCSRLGRRMVFAVVIVSVSDEPLLVFSRPVWRDCCCLMVIVVCLRRERMIANGGVYGETGYGRKSTIRGIARSSACLPSPIDLHSTQNAGGNGSLDWMGLAVRSVWLAHRRRGRPLFLDTRRWPASAVCWSGFPGSERCLSRHDTVILLYPYEVECCEECLRGIFMPSSSHLPIQTKWHDILPDSCAPSIGQSCRAGE